MIDYLYLNTSMHQYQSLLLIQIDYIQQKMTQKIRISGQREFYHSILLETFTKVGQSFESRHLFLDRRASLIISELVSESEIFGTGLTEVIRTDSNQEIDIEKVVIVMIVNEEGLADVQSKLHLFKEVSVISLTISNDESKMSMKYSPIIKKLRGFIQISLNFVPSIDYVYTANTSESPSEISFAEAFTSFLVSLPKFYEFQISHSPKLSSLAQQINNNLMKKLEVLEHHGSGQYRSTSSPRVKILLFNRSIDRLSPLVYSYYFGPLCKQIGIFGKGKDTSNNSALFNQLYNLDIQDAGKFFQDISQKKSANVHMQFGLHEFEKAKKAINEHFDEQTSPAQIKLYIQAMSSIKDFCKRRSVTTALQQTIINARSEEDEKMNNSKIVDRIQQWSKMPLEEYKHSKDDYIKILILSYMVNSFWFFQRKIINAGLEGPQKQSVISFCKSVENSCTPLEQKQQGTDRFDLFRHRPTIVKESVAWAKGERNNLPMIDINKSANNRETKYIVAMNGPLGYNELAFLMQELRKQNSLDVTFFCSRLVTTKQYLSILLPQR